MSPEDFYRQMMPFALEVSKTTGIDPRIIVAQSALETGYGRSAPGNNYFGIKGPGQTQNTTEYGANGLYRTPASFRTYDSMGDSVADYGRVLSLPRYDAVRNAEGLDAQLAALGKSGYATDPRYGQKVGAIARGIQTNPSDVNVAGNLVVGGPNPMGETKVPTKEAATQTKDSGGFLMGDGGKFAMNMGMGLLSQAIAQPQSQQPQPMQLLQPSMYRPDPRRVMGLLG